MGVWWWGEARGAVCLWVLLDMSREREGSSSGERQTCLQTKQRDWPWPDWGRARARGDHRPRTMSLVGRSYAKNKTRSNKK